MDAILQITGDAGGGGGTDLERGYGNVRPWRPPFHASPVVHKSHFKQKSQFTRPPFQEILASTASIITQILAHKPPNLDIFSSQAPKFGNFQLTSPQIWKFSTHKPPFSEANVSSQTPHFGNPGRTPLPEKKLIAPPGVTRQDPVDEKGDCSVYHGVAKLRSHGGQNSMCHVGCASVAQLACAISWNDVIFYCGPLPLSPGIILLFKG